MNQRCDRLVIRLVAFILFALPSFVTTMARAEPWLGTHFAQNCASCHAPGRQNVDWTAKRCTVTCQGCHVNPNGGGLRNLYGKWLESRWLSTWSPSAWELTKPKPARLADQPYEQQKLDKFLNSQPDAEKVKNLSENGPPLRLADSPVDESDFRPENSSYSQKIENDRAKFMLTVPKGDPLRETMASQLIAGIDTRYLYFTRSTNNQTSTYSVPMEADVGAQIRPLKHVSMVIEARFGNGPSATQGNSNFDDTFTTQPTVRSGYFLIDDLPLNSWAMYGLTQPLFGNSNPDHTDLLNSLTYGVNQSMVAVFKTLSIGTSPGIPFFNLHFLTPINNGNYSQDSGYVVNAGAHFIPYSSSVLFSYWNTNSTSTTESRREMVSVSLSAAYSRWIGVFDANHIRRNEPSGQTDAGSVASLENKVRLWRENYFELNYSWANTANDLTFGESAEWVTGLRSFPISGLDFELLWYQLRNSPHSDDSRIQGQVHFYF